MKTTLDINDQLLTRARMLAVEQHTSLTRLIEEGLQLRLKAERTARPRKPEPIPVLKGRGGLRQDIDATSNKALLRALGDDA